MINTIKYEYNTIFFIDISFSQYIFIYNNNKKKLKHGYVPIKFNCILFINYIICLTIDFNYRWINTLNEATKLK